MANTDRARKIRVGEFRVSRSAAVEGSSVPSYLALTKGTCDRAAETRKGMFFYASVNEPGQKFKRLPAFLFHSNPYKKDTEGTPWIDVVEPDVGYALFHGDNRKITRSPLEGRGNGKFAEVQHFYFEPKLHAFAPPILVFTQKEMRGSRK